MNLVEIFAQYTELDTGEEKKAYFFCLQNKIAVIRLELTEAEYCEHMRDFTRFGMIGEKSRQTVSAKIFRICYKINEV